LGLKETTGACSRADYARVSSPKDSGSVLTDTDVLVQIAWDEIVPPQIPDEPTLFIIYNYQKMSGLHAQANARGYRIR